MLHEQEIINTLISKLDVQNVHVICISLVCTEKALRKRIRKDIRHHVRSEDVLARSIKRLHAYDTLHTIKIDVSEKTVEETVHDIMQLE